MYYGQLFGSEFVPDYSQIVIDGSGFLPTGDYSGMVVTPDTLSAVIARANTRTDALANELNGYLALEDSQPPAVYTAIAARARDAANTVAKYFFDDPNALATVFPTLKGEPWAWLISTHPTRLDDISIHGLMTAYAKALMGTGNQNPAISSVINTLMAAASTKNADTDALNALFARLRLIIDDAETEYESAVWDTLTPDEWAAKAVGEWKMALDGIAGYLYLADAQWRLPSFDYQARRESLMTLAPPAADPNRLYASVVYDALRGWATGAASPLLPLNADFQMRLEEQLAPYVVTQNRVDIMSARQEADTRLMLAIADAVNNQGLSDEGITAVSALYWMRDNAPDSLEAVLKANPDYVASVNEGLPPPTTLNGFAANALSRAIRANAYFVDAPHGFGGMAGIGKWAKKQIKKLGFLSLFIPGLSLGYMAQKVNNFYQRFEDEVKKLKNVDGWKLILFGGFYLAKAVTKATTATVMELGHDMTRAIKAVNRYINPLMHAYYELVPESTRAKFSAWEQKHRKAIKIVGAIVATIVSLGQAAPQLLTELGHVIGQAIGTVGEAANLAWDKAVAFVSEKVAEWSLGDLTLEQMGEKAYNYAKDELKQRAQDKLREMGKEAVQHLFTGVQSGKDVQTVTTEVLDLTGTPPVGVPADGQRVGTNWGALVPFIGAFVALAN